MATLAEAFDLAVSQYQAGQMDMAAAICRQILHAAPDQPDTLHLLGVIEHNAGHNVEAQRLIEQAIASEGGNPTFHLNLGIVFKALGRAERAIAAYREAIDLDAQFAEALCNLCNLLAERGEMTEAVNLGRRAVEARPDLPQAHNNLANALKARGACDDAITHYRKAVELNPRSALAHRNLGNLLNLIDDHAAAVAALTRAVELDGDDPANHVGLALACADDGRLTDARRAAATALDICPDSTDALIAMGNILKDLGEPHEAIAHYQRAIRLEPDRLVAHMSLLSTLNYLWDMPPSDILARHLQWGRHVVAAAPRGPRHSNDRDPHRRLRIGYVSPDFRSHPVACFLLPILAHHREEEVEVFCYAQVFNPDAVTDRCRSHAHHWINTCGLPDDQLASRISDDRIDILIDLAGHTENSRLTVFARKPAPIQMAYLGYANTTGLETIDYRLTDDAGDPIDQCTPYVEQVIRLDAGFCVYEPHPQAPDVAPLPALSNGYITFGSLNRPAQLNPKVYDLWARVLHAVPGSHLYMNRDTFRDSVRDRLIEQFVTRGIDAARLDITHDVPADMPRIGLYNHIDIALDPFPYTGHATVCEALWMGVPVVALRGRTLIERQSAAVLAAAGCEQWIADTHDAYVDLAAKLAGNIDHLAAVRRALRHRVATSRLCDHEAFVACLERTYRRLWRTWCTPRK